jgi:hypothetical protein
VGDVAIGVHVLRSDGSFVENISVAIATSGTTEPGEVIAGRFSLSTAFSIPGDYELHFDLISQSVCWFATMSGKICALRISVS